MNILVFRIAIRPHHWSRQILESIPVCGYLYQSILTVLRTHSITILIVVFGLVTCSAQLSDCQPAASTTLLEINNIRANIGLCNYSFNDQQGNAGFEVPAGGGVHSIYIMRDWIGGYTADDQLHLAGGLYGITGTTDFYPGPLQANGVGNSSQEVCEEYAELFHASRLDALIHHEYYDRLYQVDNGADPSILTTPPFENGYSAPDYFYSWPAQNNNAGYSNYLAPFYDWNEDGIYNPDDGDYPGFDFFSAQDCISPDMNSASRLHGHEVIWQVYNDAGDHLETGGSALGVEIQNMTFGFSTCGNLNNTLFQQKRFINRSINTYYNTYIGQFADVNLGCPEDDYVGCDVSRGISYVFNGGEPDNDCNGLPGYGTSSCACHRPAGWPIPRCRWHR